MPTCGRLVVKGSPLLFLLFFVKNYTIWKSDKRYYFFFQCYICILLSKEGKLGLFALGIRFIPSIITDSTIFMTAGCVLDECT
jgi:hypothetical protein